MKYVKKNWFGILIFVSFVALGSAYIAEYIFNLEPCKMCLKQRHPYYFLIIISLIFFLFKKQKKFLLFIFNELALIYGLFYSLWHVGIEQKIFKGPASCSGTLSQTNSIQNLKEQITSQSVVNCSEISWVILGFSAATINSILLLFILIFNTIFMINNYYVSNKKI